jgi:large subunit ribosomal protein L15
MPLQRRLPKRGFTNIFRKEYAVINVKDLEKLDAGSTVDRTMLLEAGLIKKKFSLVKVLGDGEISKSFTIAVDKISKTARQKIEAAGGKIEVKEA